jgi:xylan 1,4-beta-xylosidase
LDLLRAIEGKGNEILILVLLVIACLAGAEQRTQITNPILAGFYPDPSICRVGSDFYLVNSSFSYFPGIPIFHSKDLVNWRLIGHVMDRPAQLNLDSLGVSRGIFAPSIRFHNGIFYVTCTLVDRGGNFVITSRAPEGPWSEPVWLPQVNGIDPSLFFDDDGKAYLLYNSVAPDDRPRYDGHRTIRMVGFDCDRLGLTGSEQILVDGGSDIRKHPVWIEGPHIFKVGTYYYLIAAEGGTGDQHSAVVFRSTAIRGPYLAYSRNPILTQRHLNPKRPFAITSTGHADLVQTESGDWWAVFLGCRPYPPYEDGYYNTGRETYLAPVAWKDGWPIINPEREEVQVHYVAPLAQAKEFPGSPTSGNFQVRDDFNTEQLEPAWIFLRTPRERWYDLGGKPGYLALRLRPESCSGNMNPSFLGRRQQHARGTATTALEFSPAAENEKAGLVVFQSEAHFYYLCLSVSEGRREVQLFKPGTGQGDGERMELLASRELRDESGGRTLFLRIDARGDTYAFLFASRPGAWSVLKENVDARFLSTRQSGGFVGCVYALYATSLGRPGRSTAFYDWFEYLGDDDIYRAFPGSLHQSDKGNP